MDDMWNIEVWDKVRRYFPDNGNGSRIMVTTRMASIATQLTDSHIFKLSLLDEDQSWELLGKVVFGEEDCPSELEEVGRKIAKDCKGLPLSITIIGGLLAKSPWTPEYWERIAENLKSVLNLEDDERCMKILQTSYDHLPIHLKPCFLYIGVFREDSNIRASVLIKLWVAEGFLRPMSGKSLEEVAQDYLMDLVDRNLILTKSLGFDGKIKCCHIHDLLRDMCLKQAENEKFLGVFGMHNLENQRRVIYHGVKLEENLDQLLGPFGSTSIARSFIGDLDGVVPRLPCKLLRVLMGGDYDPYRSKTSHFPEVISQLVNSRFLRLDASWRFNSVLPPVHLFWNLQTLNITVQSINAPPDIWKMHQLRHVKIGGLHLPNPPSGQEFGLWNLQSLSSIQNFKFTDEAVRKIPNIRKLKCDYILLGRPKCSDYCISNLSRLQKLESFTLGVLKRPGPIGLQENLNLPHSLKKLCLKGVRVLDWEDVTQIFGSLPLLQALRLHLLSVKGSKWSLVEGKFLSLRILQIYNCDELEDWEAESIHFPCLEHIHLGFLDKLKEIPLDIGEIPTLQSIKLDSCSKSAVISAEKILEEQEELGNFGLKIITK